MRALLAAFRALGRVVFRLADAMSSQFHEQAATARGIRWGSQSGQRAVAVAARCPLAQRTLPSGDASDACREVGVTLAVVRRLSDGFALSVWRSAEYSSWQALATRASSMPRGSPRPRIPTEAR